MYCSTCGVAVTQGLSYCNYCGAKLSGSAGDDVHELPQVRPELLVSAMAALFVLGTVAIMMLMGILKEVLELPTDRVLAITLVPFLLMLLIEGVFLRLLFRRKRSSKQSRDTDYLRGNTTKELDAAHARMLPNIPSVTEHTTRTFDPIHTERNPK